MSERKPEPPERSEDEDERERHEESRARRKAREKLRRWLDDIMLVISMVFPALLIFALEIARDGDRFWPALAKWDPVAVMPVAILSVAIGFCTLLLRQLGDKEEQRRDKEETDERSGQILRHARTLIALAEGERHSHELERQERQHRIEALSSRLDATVRGLETFVNEWKITHERQLEQIKNIGLENSNAHSGLANQTKNTANEQNTRLRAVEDALRVIRAENEKAHAALTSDVQQRAKASTEDHQALVDQFVSGIEEAVNHLDDNTGESTARLEQVIDENTRKLMDAKGRLESGLLHNRWSMTVRSPDGGMGRASSARLSGRR